MTDMRSYVVVIGTHPHRYHHAQKDIRGLGRIIRPKRVVALQSSRLTYTHKGLLTSHVHAPLLRSHTLNELNLTNPQSVSYLDSEGGAAVAHIRTSSLLIVLNSPGAAALPLIAPTATSTVRPTLPRVTTQYRISSGMTSMTATRGSFWSPLCTPSPRSPNHAAVLSAV